MKSRGRYCSVPQCIPNKLPGLSFHKIPQHILNDPKKLLHWKSVLKIEKPLPKYFLICSRHFKKNQILIPISKNKQTKVRLSDSAFPCRNLPKSSCETKVIMEKNPTQYNRHRNISKHSTQQAPTAKEESSNFASTDVPLQITLKSVGAEQTNWAYDKEKVSLCFVPGCNSQLNNQDGINFHSFPRNLKLAQIWKTTLQSCKNPTELSRVCSKHFMPGDFACVDPQVLKIHAIPSQNIPKFPIKHLVLLPEPDIMKEPIEPLPIKIPKIETSNAMTQIDKKIVYDIGIQTDSEATPTETMSYDELSAEDFYFFTGLKLPSFKELTEYLAIEDKWNMHSKSMSNYDQLTLTLIKLRHKFEFKILAKMYRIHHEKVREIFLWWISLIYNLFMKTDLWAIRYQNDSGYTAILNCCEISCESKNPKKHHLIKYLVATDEQGMVIFCSNQIFKGECSNRYVAIKSGFLSKLKNGDKVLSTFNFNVDDLMEPNGIKFLQPDEANDVKMARVYIKRITNMMKNFEILKGTFPAELIQYTTKIIYVTNVLANFVIETED